MKENSSIYTYWQQWNSLMVLNGEKRRQWDGWITRGGACHYCAGRKFNVDIRPVGSRAAPLPPDPTRRSACMNPHSCVTRVVTKARYSASTFRDEGSLLWPVLEWRYKWEWMTRQCKMCLWCFECYFHPDFQLSGWYVNDLNINIGTCMLTNAGSLAQLKPLTIEYPCSIDLCFYLHLYFLCLESRIAKLILYICIVTWHQHSFSYRQKLYTQNLITKVISIHLNFLCHRNWLLFPGQVV